MGLVCVNTEDGAAYARNVVGLGFVNTEDGATVAGIVIIQSVITYQKDHNRTQAGVQRLIPCIQYPLDNIPKAGRKTEWTIYLRAE